MADALQKVVRPVMHCRLFGQPRSKVLRTLQVENQQTKTNVYEPDCGTQEVLRHITNLEIIWKHSQSKFNASTHEGIT